MASLEKGKVPYSKEV